MMLASFVQEEDDSMAKPLTNFGLRVPVFDLAERNPAHAGILSPLYSQEQIDRHIHALFQDDVEEFLRTCPLTREGIDHWKDLIRSVMPSEFLEREDLRILDVGSGGGTSIFPLIELLPDAVVVASDLSVALLAELRRWHRDRYPSHSNLVTLQLNAEETIFEDEQFDVVTGAHILHHLVEPARALSELQRILRPGGVAIFWEPYENGAQLLSIIMRYLIAKSEAAPEGEKIPLHIVQGFQVYLADIRRRRGREKDLDLLESIDDKWVFTRTHLESLAKESGFSAIRTRNPYSATRLIELMLGMEIQRRGYQESDLPEWVRAEIADFEDQFSADFLDENPFSASIVFEKDSEGARTGKLGEGAPL
jgi:ubiquinone/menaquinone biosynthesis C-methylase UbiE